MAHHDITDDGGGIANDGIGIANLTGADRVRRGRKKKHRERNERAQKLSYSLRVKL